MKETATESYISHSTFKPDTGEKKSGKLDPAGKQPFSLLDNGSYINGAFSPVDRDVHEMAVDCPVDFEDAPQARPKMPSVDSKSSDSEQVSAAPKVSAGSMRSRNEQIKYQQSEEIKRQQEEVTI